MTMRILEDIYADEDILFQEIKKIAKSILEEKYTHGNIRINVFRIALFGYHDWTEFKISFLLTMCRELEKETGMDHQRIEAILFDRIESVKEQ